MIATINVHNVARIESRGICAEASAATLRLVDEHGNFFEVTIFARDMAALRERLLDLGDTAHKLREST